MFIKPIQTFIYLVSMPFCRGLIKPPAHPVSRQRHLMPDVNDV
jgi:hypothetical protein